MTITATPASPTDTVSGLAPAPALTNPGRGRRRVRRIGLAAFLAVATVFSLFQLANNAGAAGGSLKSQADGYMNESMSRFLSHRSAAPRPFNWNADGCSNVPDAPYGYNFKNACTRHDFGYRNYGNGLRLDRSEARRQAVDSKFLSDMNNVCDNAGWRRTHCRGIAYTYYQGVRRGGHNAFFG